MARIFHGKPYRKTVAIVGDGQTERIYFANVRDTDRPDNLSIQPDYPRRFGSYAGVLKRAVEIAGEFDHVFALIDLDKVYQDNQYAQYSAAKAGAQAEGVTVVENNPCFEIWLLLHFVHTGRLFGDCDEVVNELRKDGRIPGYNKSERFQYAAKLYGNYREQLIARAIPNAQLLEKNREHADHLFPRAETFRFFEWYLNL